MLKIFIPNDRIPGIGEKQMFYLIRPFYSETQFVNDEQRLKAWNINPARIQCVTSLEDADIVLIPHLVQHYLEKGYRHLLESYDQLCAKHRIRAFAMIQGDFGEAFPEYDHIYYLRMGGFRSQLSDHNLGMSFALSDQLEKLYQTENILIREYKDIPTIGFCGHSDSSVIKRMKEKFKFLKENVRRFFKDPGRKDYETLFASAYERNKVLQSLDGSALNTNFILRRNYRAGARSPEERDRSTREYYDNMTQSDYILCMRGGGNFSVRLYETLMMGRIPVQIDTDCVMPFPQQIDWKKHVVWIDWKDRFSIEQKVMEFHRSLSPEAFEELQFRNRKLWKETLSIQGIIEMLAA